MRGTEDVASIVEAVPVTAPSAPLKEVATPSEPKKKRSPVHRQNRSLQILLWTVTALVIWYVNTSVLRYLNQTREVYGLFWPRHGWLFVHAISGTIALALGPVQFWPGVKEEQPMLHRVLGIAYVAGAIGGSITAYYLAYHTGFGWLFGAGLCAMATAWITTTGMATIAIYRRMIAQHREWMIRSYVVTFGFIFMRLTTEILDTIDVGTITERLVFASWICWSLPLCFTEAFLQGRKVFAPAPD